MENEIITAALSHPAKEYPPDELVCSSIGVKNLEHAFNDQTKGIGPILRLCEAAAIHIERGMPEIAANIYAEATERSLKMLYPERCQ